MLVRQDVLNSINSSPPEIVWLLDKIRAGVAEMDSENEDSIDQIPALRKIVKASVEALSQLEIRKDRWVACALDLMVDEQIPSFVQDYRNSQQVEERS